MTTATALTHEPFCLSRPGEDAPRIETYHAPKYVADGITPAGSTVVERCQECGATLYDGQRRG